MLDRVRWLRAGTEKVALELKDELDTDKLDELAEALDLLRQTRGILSDLERHVEGAVADAMTSKEQTVGDYHLERRSGWERKWAESAVLSRLTIPAASLETGERIDALDLKTVREVFGLRPRVTALRQYGVLDTDPPKPDDEADENENGDDPLFTWEKKRPTVQATRHELAENPDEVAS